jgi:hypothetical protein
MDFQSRLLPERFVTHDACKGLLTVMYSAVHLEAASISKHFFTHFTHMKLWICVQFNVPVQVIRTSKRLTAHMAFKVSISAVWMHLSDVSPQIIQPTEQLVA